MLRFKPSSLNSTYQKIYIGYWYNFPSFPNWTGIITPDDDEDLKQQKVTQGNEEGYLCCHCQKFSPMAELNLPEGSNDPVAFGCYECRNGLSL